MEGKLNPFQLKECVFDIIKKRRAEVINGAAVAEDCAVLNLEGEILVSSDPITASSENAGRLAIDINVNDIAASGGEPVAALLTIIAPISAGVDEIKRIMIDAESAAKRCNLEICGGHTEFSDAVNRTIISATVIGITDKKILSSTPKVGDTILITKYAGLEGTFIFYNELSSKLHKLLSQEDINQIQNTDISVLAESKLVKNLNISAMHDITEGGVSGAVKEMCEASGLGANIYKEKVPLLTATKKICDFLNINPYKLISSGSMLITTNEPETVIKVLSDENIKVTAIGEITSKENGTYLIDKDSNKTLLEVEADEITKINSIKNQIFKS